MCHCTDLTRACSLTLSKRKGTNIWICEERKGRENTLDKQHSSKVTDTTHSSLSWNRKKRWTVTLLPLHFNRRQIRRGRRNVANNDGQAITRNGLERQRTTRLSSLARGSSHDNFPHHCPRSSGVTHLRTSEPGGRPRMFGISRGPRTTRRYLIVGNRSYRGSAGWPACLQLRAGNRGE